MTPEQQIARIKQRLTESHSDTTRVLLIAAILGVEVTGAAGTVEQQLAAALAEIDELREANAYLEESQQVALAGWVELADERDRALFTIDDLNGLIEEYQANWHDAEARAAELQIVNDRVAKSIEGDIDRQTISNFFQQACNWNIDIKGKLTEPVMRFFGAMMEMALEDINAENYVTAKLHIRAAKFELTIRRIEGLTPQEKYEQAAKERDEAQARAGAAEHIAELARAYTTAYQAYQRYRGDAANWNYKEADRLEKLQNEAHAAMIKVFQEISK